MLNTRPELSISPEKIGFIIAKTREFEVQDLAIEEEEDSDDDAKRAVREDAHDPAFKELCAFINALSEDEQIDLVALTWLGRGDGTFEDWDARTGPYLLAKPFLPDHLEEGLAQFGISCAADY